MASWRRIFSREICKYSSDTIEVEASSDSEAIARNCATIAVAAGGDERRDVEQTGKLNHDGQIHCFRGEAERFKQRRVHRDPSYGVKSWEVIEKKKVN